jgi:hypothetical protein
VGKAVACACAALGFSAAPAVPATAFTFSHAVEASPPQYASGPTQDGVVVERRFSSPQAVQAFCNFYLGRPARGYYQACYIPAMDTVALPDEHAWPSKVEREALRAHEWAHARGWRHGALKTASAALY